MKISLETSGGFAGLHRSISIDTESLSYDEKERLLELVKSANLFNARSAKPKRGADYIIYKIKVEEEGKSNTIEVTDISMSKALRELVDFLKKR